MANAKLCQIPGCEKKHHAHGYCANHAYHFKKHGDPLAGGRNSSPGDALRWIEEHAAYSGNDCIKWPFEITRYGYGTVLHNGQKRVASRVMCELVHGLPPGDFYDAAHTCGNGHAGCMNPNHLAWKTRKENMADAIAHGTWKRGSNDANAKLSDEDIVSIRKMALTMKQKDIARKFGVTQPTISKVVSRKRWAWLE